MNLDEIKVRWLVDGMSHEGCRKRPDNGCDLLDLIAVVEAAQNLIDHGREWIGGTKYCPECMAEGWHYEGCKSGQEFWDLRKALEDAVRA